MEIIPTNEMPLRKVETFRSSPGARGGLFYFLTLECGHIVTRRAQQEHDFFFGSHGFHHKPAPQKARCKICAYEAKGYDV